jgi:hypothetical protein
MDNQPVSPTESNPLADVLRAFQGIAQNALSSKPYVRDGEGEEAIGTTIFIRLNNPKMSFTLLNFLFATQSEREEYHNGQIAYRHSHVIYSLEFAGLNGQRLNIELKREEPLAFGLYLRLKDLQCHQRDLDWHEVGELISDVQTQPAE